MKLYSDFPLARSRQVTGDVIAVVIVVLSIVIGVVVHSAIAGLATAGVKLEGAGNGLRQNLSDAARRLADVPLVGNGIRRPFDSAAESARSLADAGSGTQTAVGVTAATVGITVALVPILLVTRYWFTRRVRFARRAAVARDLVARPGGMELLALRALTSSEPKDLYRVSPDPVTSWRSGDASVISSLAALALSETGVRIPA